MQPVYPEDDYHQTVKQENTWVELHFRLVPIQSWPGPARASGTFRDSLVWGVGIANALAELREPKINQALSITTHQAAEQVYGGHKMDSLSIPII